MQAGRFSFAFFNVIGLVQMKKINSGIPSSAEKTDGSVESPGGDAVPGDLRNNTTFTSSLYNKDPVSILAPVFGPRFLEYRENYKKSLNYDTNGYIPDFPLTLTIEPVNRCNLSCVMCYTVNHAGEKHTLELGDIKRIFEECGANQMPALVAGLGSEPLLFKGIRDVLKMAVEARIMDIFLGTNGVLLTDDLSRFLVDQQVARVEISLDAAKPETFRKIRGKDELEKIESNIRNLVRIRNEAGSALPVLRLCFCVQDLNNGEVEEFKAKWKDVADYIDFQQLIDFSKVDEFRGDKAASEVLKPTDASMNTHCAYPFNSLNVWADGNVTPCCTFYAKSEAFILGNIKSSTLKELWDGEAINAIRQQLLSGQPNAVCKACLENRDKESFDSVKAGNEKSNH